MDRKNTASPDFNLFDASDTALGTLAAICELMQSVPTRGVERTLWNNRVSGLANAGCKAAREMNLFIYEATDTQQLPVRWEDIERDPEPNGVRETAAVYSLR